MVVEVYCDGLCEPTNPGGFGAWGFVIVMVEHGRRDLRTVVDRGHGAIGWDATNNVAEYTAAIEGVRRANERFMGFAKVLCSDSQLVVRQIDGRFTVASPRIMPLYRRLSEEMRRDKGMWSARWVPREQNREADEESRKAVVEAIGKWPERGRLVDAPDHPDAPGSAQSDLGRFA